MRREPKQDAAIHRVTMIARLCALAMLCGVILGCTEELPKKARADLAPQQLSIDAKAPEQSRVLLVHSYHAEYPWVAAITRGVHEVLDPMGVALDVVYMDTKRVTTEAWKREAGDRAFAAIESTRPDVVITADDNAQQYFAMRLAGERLPVFFCGVNADPAKYGYPAANISGIIERPHVRESVAFLNQLVPIRKIAILSSNDPTSVGALTFMRERLNDFEVTEFRLVSTFDEWKSAVLSYNDSVDAFGVYMYHTLLNAGSDASMEPAAVMEWTRQNARVPTVGFLDFGIQDGLLCGVVESGEEHGREAARFALKALSGVPIADMPILRATAGKRMINKATAARLGVDVAGAAFADVEFVTGK